MGGSRRAAVALVSLVGVAAGSAGCHDGRAAAGTSDLGPPDGGAAATGSAMSFCCTDSDCGNAYLTCAASPVSICKTAERAPVEAGAAPACGFPDYVPSCPTEEQVTVSLCLIRYQLPCRVDSDCGPAGFTCNAGVCAELPTTHPCAGDDDCPQGWSCYSPCPCNGTDTEPKGCYPPFAQFHCDVCITGTVDDAGAYHPPDA